MMTTPPDTPPDAQRARISKAHGCEDTDDLRQVSSFLGWVYDLPRRPTFASEAKKKQDVIITVLHGRHRGQERPVIDALDQQLALEQRSFCQLSVRATQVDEPRI